MKWQQKYTGTMNRSPTPNGVFAVYFVVDVDNLRNVHCVFRVWWDNSRNVHCVFRGWMWTHLCVFV